jgi:phosphate-selective porin
MATLALGALSGAASAQQPSAPPSADPKPATVKASEKDGFVLESADGAYRLRLTGYVQVDGRFGLNWYLNRHAKLVGTYERTTFEGGARDGDRAAENALLFRAQVYF